MRNIFALLILFLAYPSASVALDSGHFKGLAEGDIDYVLTAFQNVNLYYLVPEKGGNALFGPRSNDPKISFPIRYGLMLYFNPLVAKQTQANLNGKSNGKFVVRTTQADKIIRAQFSKRNAQPSEDINNPDFVILHSYGPIMDAIEFIASSDHKPFIQKSSDGSNVIPAFLDRNKALNYQSALAKKGIKVERIGLDEGAFIEFVKNEGRRGNFILIEGF